MYIWRKISGKLHKKHCCNICIYSLRRNRLVCKGVDISCDRFIVISQAFSNLESHKGISFYEIKHPFCLD